MTYLARPPRVTWLTSGLALAFLATGQEAAAQFDPGEAAKRPPNVLLIVDTSGSMEYEAGLNTFPTCDATGSVTSERSRWVDLVEVLSGTINSYRCRAIDRSSSEFTALYNLPGGQTPPDYTYRNPYHRPLSGTCGLTPNTVPWSLAPANTFDFISPAYHLYNDNAGACSPAFTQSGDGLIDAFNGDIRFGLMTFDTLTDAGDGFIGASSDYADGVRGAWSYFNAAAATGRPSNCLTAEEPFEVGARNGAAPTWEGKLIPFGPPAASASQDTERNLRVERVLLSTRPYGATPIAGALTDAQTFLTVDNQPDPTSASDLLHTANYGPKDDPYIVAGCRDQYIILLTDGEPNLDLRPHCEGSDPAAPDCPYDQSEVVAAELEGLANPIKTFVVGFAPDTAPTPDSVDCKIMPASAWGPGGACTTAATEEMRVCCTLHEIADAGGTGRAYFGNDKTALRTQLSNVFNRIISGGGSATQPVRSPGKGDAETGTGSVAFRVLTSYEGSATGVWAGNIERLRWTCPSGVPEEAEKTASLGDDFSFNVNSHPTARTFMTHVPTAVAGVIHSDRSVRPNISAATGALDGIGQNAGATVAGNQTTFVTNVPQEALQPDLVSGPCTGLTAATCKARLLPWLVGMDNGSTNPNNQRCAAPAIDEFDRNCSVIGDVMHSTPVIVDHPTAEIEDETYSAFRLTALGAIDRPMMVYTSSNDGFLHGFKLSPNKSGDAVVNTSASNEIFAFVPPAVLPQIDSQYPTSHQKLLDGAPVVQDVVATLDNSNTYYGFRLQRSASGAQAASTTFRTILVQSFGGSQSGYFAVDITRPTDAATPGTFNSIQTGTPNGQPRMLWQLTKDSLGNPLFGERTATPLITTLNVGGDEVAVAVLPGGYGSPTASVCDRWDDTHPQILGSYAPREQVRCYTLDQDNDGTGSTDISDDANYIGARSLTIVRLDSGEVIVRFRRHATLERPVIHASKIALASLDSPITGTPAAYPVGPGAVSDRIFVGDQDGTLWRVDTSSTTPADWKMELFFDTFATHPVPASAAASGRPIVVAPTLSVNELGQITVAIATGDQDLSGAAGEYHYVWSLLEQFSFSSSAPYNTLVKWYQELENGEHVLGPIRLNEGILYYSTFLPQVTDCAVGESRVFGVDYLEGTGTAGEGGAGRLSLVTGNDEANFATPEELGLADGAIIFGVNLEYAPSCFDESSGLTSALLGGGHLSATNASASTLQLAFQTGAPSEDKEPLGFKTGFGTAALNQPTSAATIESWAAILE